MPTAQYGASLSAGGVTIQQTVNRTNDGPIALQTSVAAGKAGTLSTRTDNDTGILTVTAGHNVVDTDTVDLYWSGGSRYNVDVTAVTSTTISIDAGSGDNLPSAAAAIVVCEHAQANLIVDGDNVMILGVCAESTDPASTAKARATFKDVSGNTIATVLLTANVPQVWDITGGTTNAFTGAVITNIQMTNGSSSEALTFKIVGMQDATP